MGCTYTINDGKKFNSYKELSDYLKKEQNLSNVADIVFSAADVSKMK